MKPRLSGRAVARDEPRGAEAFEQAVLLHRGGRPFQADALCAQALRANPRHHGAWHLRGLIALESGRLDEGIEWIERSLALHARQPSAHSNVGNAWLEKGDPERALGSFERALRLDPDHLPALYNRGNALRALRRFEEALASYDRALHLKGNHVAALNNRGLALAELGRSEEARASFERAVLLDPRFAPAHRNLAATLLRLGRHAQAVASCDEALRLDPADLESLIGRATALQALQRPAEALEDYERALALAPDCVLALNNSGNALAELGRPEAALARYDRALELAPGFADAWYNRGAALRELKRHEQAASSFEEALRIAPEHDAALDDLFHLRMRRCDWRDYESLGRRLHEALGTRKQLINPLTLLLLPGEPQLPLECARAYVEAHHAEALPGERRARPARRAAGRIRIAYLSADLREHPVAHLLVGALERHDRAAFEVLGVSLREAEESEIGRRVRASFDTWIEVQDRTDREVAALLREREVDIAVDLMGFTEGMRLGILAQGAAPVQVSYLGYAGTLGAAFIDYLIADEIVIPAGEEHRYGERIVRLPDCYLPHDDRRPIAAGVPSRAAAGLPEAGFVFCAFASAFKLNPPMFAAWMRLLAAVPGSVLWLRSMAHETCANLRREAAVRGVDPERVVFAPYARDMASHLARLGLADLYLDTVPYNAHSTACDALWAGVPVISCAGRSMASRTAASALNAAGLPELVTDSLEDYERRARRLAEEPGELRRLRARLAASRGSAPLFDTARHTRHLEAAYRTMHERALRGEPPLGFTVKPAAEPGERMR